MLLPWKFWSPTRRTLTVLLPILFLMAMSALLLIGLHIESPLPVIGGLAAIIALGSLVTSAWTAYTSWFRTRKKDTLAAWEAWSDGSKEDRSAFTKVFGQNVGLNDDQAAAVCDQHQLSTESGGLSDADSADMRRRIMKVLGGLERLAVGIEHHVYDLDLIMEIGGTIIIGTYERYSPYIKYLQNHPNLDKRKTHAYICLGALVAEIKGEQAREKRTYFDSARVARIDRAIGKTKAS